MKPTIPEILPIIQKYYAKPENCVGGSLHITLEDGNVKDSDVLVCKQLCLERNDQDGLEISDILLKMSKTQRLKLSGMNHITKTPLVS